jgi:hypothetical protein
MMELNDHVPIITGIPLHVEQLHQLEELKNHCIEIKAAVNSFIDTLEESVTTAIDKTV